MANLFQPSINRATDSNGNVAPYAKLYFWLAGTMTSATFYLDPEGTSPGSNPLTANLAGQFTPVYLDPDTTYRIKSTSQTGSQIFYDVDNVRGFDESQFSLISAQIEEDAAQVAADRLIVEGLVEDAEGYATVAQGAALSNGFYPGARSYVPQGLKSVAITAAGSGGTNGTYIVPLTGDNLSVDAFVNVTVAGGAITAVSVNAPGLYIGASLNIGSVVLSSITGLTGATVTPTGGYLVNSGEYYYTDHASDPLKTARFQNQSNVAVEVDANVDYLDVAAIEALVGEAEAFVLTSEYDAPQLFGEIATIGVFGPGTAGTYNVDGSFTVPASSQNLIRIRLLAGDNGVENTSEFIVTADFLDSADLTNFTSMTVQLFDASGTAWCPAKNVDQTFLSKTLSTIAFTKGSGVTTLPASAQVIVNTNAGGPITFRLGLFESEQVPFIRRPPAVVEQYVSASLVDNTVDMPTLPRYDYQITAASAIAIGAALVANGGKTVDAVYGSDANSGTYLLPKATFAGAISASSAGDFIGLKAGQRHFTSRDTTSGVALNRAVHGVGGSSMAVLDARQDISSLTWVQDGSTGCWETIATHRFLPVTAANITQNTSVWSLSRDYSIYRRDWYDWYTGDVSIAANKAAVQAADSGFTAWPNGTTSPEPRIATAQLTYKYYFKPGDGLDPNTLDLFINDISVVEIFGQDSSNLEVIGSMWKDNTQTPLLTTPVKKLTNHYRPRCNQHANVGPVEISGYFHGIAQSAPGYNTNGRAVGGCVNMFPGGMPTVDIHHDVIIAENFGISALYCHSGDGTQPFFRNVTVEKIIGINCATLAAFGYRTVAGIPGSTTILGEFILNSFWATEHGTTVIIPGAAYNLIQNGYVEFSTNPLDTQTGITDLTFCPRSATVEIKDSTFLMPGTDRTTRFCSIGTQCQWSNPVDYPTVILDNVRDISDPRAGIVLWSTFSTPDYFHLTIKGGSVLGDLSPNGNGYPRGTFTVEAGCTFGLGNRTRAEIRTFLDSVSVDHNIDDDTTIVNEYGVIIDYPA